MSQSSPFLERKNGSQCDGSVSVESLNITDSVIYSITMVTTAGSMHPQNEAIGIKRALNFLIVDDPLFSIGL